MCLLYIPLSALLDTGISNKRYGLSRCSSILLERLLQGCLKPLIHMFNVRVLARNVNLIVDIKTSSQNGHIPSAGFPCWAAFPIMIQFIIPVTISLAWLCCVVEENSSLHGGHLSDFASGTAVTLSILLVGDTTVELRTVDRHWAQACGWSRTVKIGTDWKNWLCYWDFDFVREAHWAASSWIRSTNPLEWLDAW